VDVALSASDLWSVCTSHFIGGDASLDGDLPVRLLEIVRDVSVRVDEKSNHVRSELTMERFFLVSVTQY
jgi:hypothetical protein